MNHRLLHLFARSAISVVLSLGSLSALAVDYFQSAQDYYQAKELEAAVIQLKNLINDDPKHAEGRFLLGKIYLEQGNAPAAEVTLDKALSLGVDAGRISVSLAQSYLGQGKFEKVLGVARAFLIEDKGAAAEMAVIEGYAHLGLGNTEEASAAFNRSIVKQPGAKAKLGLVRVHLKQKRFDKGFALVEEVIASGEEQTDALLLRGALYLGEQRLDQAIKDYTQVLDLQSGHIPALLARAEALFLSKKLSEAEADVSAIQKITPGHIEVIGLQARIDFERKDFKAALSNTQAILSANPNHQSSLLIAAAINFSGGDFLLAEGYLSRYLQLAGDVFVAQRMQAALYIAQRRAPEAVEVLEGLISTGVDKDPQVYALLGTAYAMEEREAESLEALNKSVSLAPDISQFRNQLALAYLFRGKTDEAIEQLESATKGVDSVVGERLLILSYIQSSQLELAYKRIGSAEQGDPANPLYPYLKGLAYKRGKDAQASAQAFEQALKIDQTYLPALMERAQQVLAEGDEIAGRDYYMRVLQVVPQHLDAMLALARLEDKNKRPEKAREWVEKALKENPTAEKPALLLVNHYLRSNQKTKAMSLASQFARSAPGSRVGMSMLAKTQMANGEVEAAERTLENYILKYPEDVEHQFMLAGVFAGRKSYSQAIEILSDVVRLNPKFETAWIMRVNLLVAQKSFVEALATIDEYKKRFAGSNALEGAYGDFYAAQGQWDKAIEKYLNYYKYAPSSAMAIRLADAYQLAKRQNNSLEILSKHLSIYNDDLGVRLKLAGLLYEKGDLDEAKYQYQEVFYLKSDSLIALNNLAILLQEKDPLKATEYAEQAYKVSNQHYAVADTLGWLYLNNGRSAEGLTLIQAAFEKMPENLQIQYHLGVALQQAGKNDEARFRLRSLLANERIAELEERKSAEALLAQLK